MRLLEYMRFVLPVFSFEVCFIIVQVSIVYSTECSCPPPNPSLHKSRSDPRQLAIVYSSHSCKIRHKSNNWVNKSNTTIWSDCSNKRKLLKLVYAYRVNSFVTKFPLAFLVCSIVGWQIRQEIYQYWSLYPKQISQNTIAIISRHHRIRQQQKRNDTKANGQQGFLM